jgi:hypothetical protein
MEIAKTHSLCTIKLFNKTQLLIFSFKIYPYLLEDDNNELYQKLTEYF